MQHLEIAQVFKQVKGLFTWVADAEKFGKPDHWQDYADDVIHWREFSGDCDDFALTVLAVGIRFGKFKPELCRVARVLTEDGDRSHNLNHAVAIYDGIVLDNRQPKPVPIEHMTHYRFYDYSELPLGEWKLYENPA